MALIKCPECGHEVSDRTTSCPRCGFPIATASPSGIVRIKVSALNRAALGGGQKVTITAVGTGKILWNGQAGEVAEIRFESPTSVEVKYHTNFLYYGGSCTGTIDPSKSRKYNVSVRQGICKVIPVLQAVDVIDSD